MYMYIYIYINIHIYIYKYTYTYIYIIQVIMPVVIHVVTETSLSFNKDTYISMLFCEISYNTCMRSCLVKSYHSLSIVQYMIEI